MSEPGQMDSTGLAHRVARIEEEHREIRTDIRNLTDAVSKLATSVAVLAERIGCLVAPPAQAAAHSGRGTAALITLGGAIGAGILFAAQLVK